jgi:hypothetical protein
VAENSDTGFAGHLVKAKGNRGHLIRTKRELPRDFERGRLAGKDQEHTRIVQLFHNELRPGLMAVVFKLEVLELQLEAAGSPYMEKAVEAARLLSETVDQITASLGDNPL